jgi:hypothetical protein
VDGQDQSVMEGPFLWGARAHARCLLWQPRKGGGRLSAEHDGYLRLSDPVRHRRTVDLDARTLVIEDALEAGGEHEVALHFHFAEHCRVQVDGSPRVTIAFPGGSAVMTLDPRLAVSVAAGGEGPIAGWVSRAYHRKTPAPEIAGRGRFRGPVSLTTHLQFV